MTNIQINRLKDRPNEWFLTFWMQHGDGVGLNFSSKPQPNYDCELTEIEAMLEAALMLIRQRQK
jgi:hypothetical protein